MPWIFNRAKEIIGYQSAGGTASVLPPWQPWLHGERSLTQIGQIGPTGKLWYGGRILAEQRRKQVAGSLSLSQSIYRRPEDIKASKVYDVSGAITSAEWISGEPRLPGWWRRSEDKGFIDEILEFNKYQTERGRYGKPVDPYLLFGEQEELALRTGELDYFTDPKLLKWRKRQAAERSGFYRGMHPSTLSPDLLAKRGYAYKRGKFYELFADIEDLPTTFSVAERLKGKTRHIDVATGTFLEEVGPTVKRINEGKAAWGTNLGYSIEEGTKKIGGKIGAEVPREIVEKDIINWELGAHFREKELVSRVMPNQFFAPGKNVVIGTSKENVHFWDPLQQMLYGKEVLGQTKYIRTSSGRVIHLGQRNITGVYLRGNIESSIIGQNVGFVDIFEEHRRMKRLSPRSAFYSARSKYFKHAERMDPVSREELASALFEAGGNDALIEGQRIAKGSLDLSKAKELQKNFWSFFAPGGITREMQVEGERLESIKGQAKQKLFVENAEIGTRVRLKGGIRGIIEAAEKPEHISYMMANGKSISLAERFALDRAQAEKLFFPVRMVREPGFYPWKLPKGETSFDQYALSVKTAAGHHLSYVDQGLAEKMYENILSGTLPEENLFGKVLYNERRKQHYLELYKNEAGAFAPTGIKLRRAEGIAEQTILGRIAMGEGSEYLAGAENIGAFFGEKFKTKLYDTEELAIAARASKVASAGKVASGAVIRNSAEAAINKRLWVGVGIAAGAMLLWGASRIGKHKPISEKDVPSSLYGPPNHYDFGGGASYSPQTRVTPQNTGYATNVEMETQDMRGIIDYRGIANNLGMMSRSALGTSSGNTSLHVVDDSSRMDQHSIRRQMNQQLNI